MGNLIAKIVIEYLPFFLPFLPSPYPERLQRKELVCKGCSQFVKKATNTALFGFSLSKPDEIVLWVRTEGYVALCYKNAFSSTNNDSSNDRVNSNSNNKSNSGSRNDYIQDRGHEILSSDIQSIVGKGEKTILIRGRNAGQRIESYDGSYGGSIDSDIQDEENYLEEEEEEETMITNQSRQQHNKRQESKGSKNYLEFFPSFLGAKNKSTEKVQNNGKQKNRKDKKMERDVILEIESKIDGKHRDEWLLALNEVLLQNFDADTLINEPKSLKEKADKEIYFQKRQMEIADRKKEAQARKEKYMKEAGGLKYTALAMANRA